MHSTRLFLAAVAITLPSALAQNQDTTVTGAAGTIIVGGASGGSIGTGGNAAATTTGNPSSIGDVTGSPQSTGDITGSGNGSGSACPDGNGADVMNDKTICCKGILQGSTACLVGCSLTKPACFPFCTDQPNSLSTTGSCSTVPVTASDYTQRVYGSGATATATSSGASVASTGSGSSAGASGGSSSSSHGGAAVITAAPVLAAGALAGLILL